MSFNLRTIKDSRDNRDRVKTSTVATTTGFLYKNNLSSGALEACSNTTTASEVLYYSNETILAGDARTTVNCTVVSAEDEFLVDTANNAVTTHNGQRMILGSTGATLNNTGTDSTTGVFVQVDVVGVSTAKQILARRIYN